MGGGEVAADEELFGQHLRGSQLADYELEVVARTVHAQQGTQHLAHNAYRPPLNRTNIAISASNANRDRYMPAAEEFLAPYDGGG